MTGLLFLLPLYLHPPPLANWPEIPPPLSALDMFPNADECDRQLTWFAGREKWLQGERGLFPDPRFQPYWEAAIDDLEARRDPWKLLSEAREWTGPPSVGENYSREERQAAVRRKLAKLRAMLGEWDFANGAMPGPIDRAYTRPAD